MKRIVSITVPVFLAALGISLVNANFQNLGFADAAEFALSAKLLGIAHAPGFPAYVLIAGLWLKLTTLFGIPTIASLVIFSALCTAKASAFLALTVDKLSAYYYPELNQRSRLLNSIAAGILLAAGATVWHWSHSVEVYSLHLLAFCILMYGIVLLKTENSKFAVAFIATGAGIGIANHHLTMILFLPFVLFLLWKDWNPQIKITKSQTIITARNGFQDGLLKKLILSGAGVVLLFYGWMFIRASAPILFKFGQPDSIDRLIYHLAGGAWIKNTQQEVEGLVGMRFPYFMQLTWQQLGLLIPVCAAAFYMLTRNARMLGFVFSAYYFVVLLYQLRIDQTADTDAYMILPFAGLTLLGGLTLSALSEKKKEYSFVFLAMPFLHFALFYKITDLQKFDLSTTILKQIDEAAPPNSVILFADWTAIINYTQARIDKNFRPDLVVLNYDLKFTNKDFLPANYPEAYAFIKPEYDRFIQLLGERHPQEVYNTGLTMDTRELENAYHTVVAKLEAFAKQKNGAFMCDPKAFVFLSKAGHFKNSRMSGILVSNLNESRQTTLTDLSRQQWLDVPHIRMDAAAADKLVDLEAAIDFTRNEYRQTGNQDGLVAADNAYNRVKSIQRELKQNMPFLFRPPGK
jgi:hypothetical protein